MQPNLKKVTFSRLGARTLGTGVVFVAVGSLGAFMFLGLGPFNPLHLISLIFPFAGVVTLLSGGWIKIHPSRQSLIVTDGIFGLFRVKNYSFNQIKHVELQKRISRSSKRTYTQYEAVIIFNNGETKNAGDKIEFSRGRVRAEKIAKALRVGCLDRVTLGAELRPFSELDTSLVERLKNGLVIKGDGVNNRQRIRFERGVFVIGTRGFGREDLFELIIALVIFIPLSILIGHNVMKVLPALFWPVTIVIIAAPLLHHTLLMQKIEISKTHITVTSAILSLAVKKYMALDKLEEIVDYDQTLVLRSDFKEITFGGTLNKKERLWLRARICQELYKG